MRQCDGGQVQCLVMVRGDFWMAATRFMRELEIRLMEDHNAAAVALFPVPHAERVLAAFGRAFGALPEQPSDMRADQQQFLQQAAAGLSKEGKVISVRLALFAQMLKDRPWVLSELQQVGGTAGVGVTFLEETFSASTSPPEHRYHEKAARSVLRALLPESGTNIRGQMRSYEDLLEASGYTHRRRDFDALLNLLDSELRLITPTAPEGMQSADSELEADSHRSWAGVAPDRRAGAGLGKSVAPDMTAARSREAVSRSRPAFGARGPLPTKHYQLAHDYLVPALRDWLTRKQQETRRGRAELQLAERAALWNAKPENRHLPSWWEYLRIACLTARTHWTEPQRKMMHHAGRVLGVRGSGVLLLALLIGITVHQVVASVRRRTLWERTQTAVAAMSNSRGTSVPRAIRRLEELPPEMVLAELRARFGDSAEGRRLPLAYALARFHDVRADFLVSQIKDASADDVDNLVAALGAARQPAVAALQAAAGAIDGDWRYKARVGIAALHLGDASVARDMSRLRSDPIQRTLLIDSFPKWHSDLAGLAPVVARTTDAEFRSGVCLGIGGIPAEHLTAEAKQAWQPLLSEWYQVQPDPGTHSAAGWVLRKWQRPLPRISSSREPVSGHEWYVNSLGMTMLRISAGRFIRHDELADNATAHEVRLTHPFFLSDREVSVGSFQQFVEDTAYREEKPVNWIGPDPVISPTSDHPVQRVNWEDAVLFCNWLSRKERLMPCYEGSSERAQTAEAYPGLRAWTTQTAEAGLIGVWRPVAEANGYRLPTEAEWEYALRAGSVTTYAHGEDVSLLSRYAVFAQIRSEPCGSKLPNRWGLFDMNGNVWEWGADWYDPDYFAKSPRDDPPGPQQGSVRIFRGGAFSIGALRCRSACRGSWDPSARDNFLGFRVARSVSGE